jgi:hypothetical protein
MNFKSTAFALLLLNSAFSLQSAVQTSAQNQAQQVALSAEEQEAFNQIFEQMVSFIIDYMMKHKLTVAVCDSLVCEIKNDQVFIRDASTLTVAELTRIPNITKAVFEEITATINAMTVA